MSSGMTTVEQVKQCRTPQEALLLLATTIDALIESPVAADPWSTPILWDGPDVVFGPTDVVRQPDDGRAVIEGGDVIVKPVSPERKEQRYCFALDNRLSEFYGPSLSTEAFVDAYVKGGPRWLYYTNREAVMAMPIAHRQALVADVLLDSPSEADEIGRDILKFDFDEGARETEQLDYQRAARDLGPLV